MTDGGDPISHDLLRAAWHSLALLGVSLAAALPLGLAWGALLASVRQRTLRFVLFGTNMLAISLPSFALMLLGMEAVAELSLRRGINIGYIQGYGLDGHLILPASVLVLRGAATIARSLQVAHEDILHQDWLRVARAKGLGGFRLWYHHVLPALRLPLL
jgi:ABC-type dipeptide/oligopeptide/nickel transport system permease component